MIPSCSLRAEWNSLITRSAISRVSNLDDVRSAIEVLAEIPYRANPTSLLTPEGASRQILVETAWYGKKCLARSYSVLVHDMWEL